MHVSMKSFTKKMPGKKPLYVATLLGLSVIGTAQTQAAICSYTLVNEWNTGFQGAVTITNNTSTAINGWNLAWQYTNNRITGSWNANITGNNPYSASNLDWNKTIQPGQSISFGVQGDKNGATEKPVVTGSVCGAVTTSSSSSKSSFASSSSSKSSVASSSSAKSSVASSSSKGAVSSARSSLASSSFSVDSANGFELVFRDDFNSFDSSRWQLMTHSWSGNLAVFSSQAVSFANGLMTIALQAAPAGTVVDGETKNYLGAEVRSKNTITYGRVTARAKFAKGSAVVSSLFTIYTPWPADNWNELDIESLGKNPSEMQYNAMVYTGPKLTPPVTTSVTPTQAPLLKPLGFDASAEFHNYTIEWTPERATFLVDDVLQYTWTNRIDLMTLPQNVLMSIWVSNSVSWAGPVTSDTINAKAVYDWIEVWQYKP